jgi:hypothetical protein
MNQEIWDRLFIIPDFALLVEVGFDGGPLPFSFSLPLSLSVFIRVHLWLF